MAPARGLAVRFGQCVAHAVDAAQAAELMMLLCGGSRAASDTGNVGLASSAADLLATSVSVTAVLGAQTLAKGLAMSGKTMPTSLKRDLRVLDGAAALLRHPGSSTRVLARLREWKQQVDVASSCPASTDAGSSDGGPPNSPPHRGMQPPQSARLDVPDLEYDKKEDGYITQKCEALECDTESGRDTQETEAWQTTKRRNRRGKTPKGPVDSAHAESAEALQHRTLQEKPIHSDDSKGMDAQNDVDFKLSLLKHDALLEHILALEDQLKGANEQQQDMLKEACSAEKKGLLGEMQKHLESHDVLQRRILSLELAMQNAKDQLKRQLSTESSEVAG